MATSHAPNNVTKMVLLRSAMFSFTNIYSHPFIMHMASAPPSPYLLGSQLNSLHAMLLVQFRAVTLGNYCDITTVDPPKRGHNTNNLSTKGTPNSNYPFSYSADAFLASKERPTLNKGRRA